MTALARIVVTPVIAVCLLAGVPLERGPAADDPPAPRRVTLKFGHQEPEPFNPQRWLFSPEVVAGKDGTVRLARSVLLSEDVGATDHHHVERLTKEIWAAKELSVHPLEATGADLFFYGTATKVLINGKTMSEVERVPSTGWSRVRIPVGVLKTETEFHAEFENRHKINKAESPPPPFEHYLHNHVTIQGPGSILFVPQEESGSSDAILRNKRSPDAGRSWSAAGIGNQADRLGAYVVRLRVPDHSSQGIATSPVLDLWAGGERFIPTPSRLICIPKFSIRSETIRHQHFKCFMRTGRTPSADDGTWTPWIDLFDEYRPTGESAGHRWAQLRVQLTRVLKAQDRRIPSAFEFEYELQPQLPVKTEPNLIRPAADRPPRLTSIPFIYETPSPRLKLLREQYQLDKVIAPGKTEMEQLMLLRHWVRNQWHTAWGTHPAAWMPPWDTLQILACKDQPDCLTMCTHYGCVFTQCCLALGWNARHCILDHHCTAEVWVDQYQKWVMMDSGNSPTRPDCNLHFERKGVPLSALELHLSYRDKKTDGIMVCFTPKALMEAIAPLCRKPPVAHAPGSPRPETVPLSELKNFPVCGLENYRRYAFPGRNNYLTSLYPGELYQGWAEYFYDGYWWVGDERDDPQLSPEYSKHLPPSRPQDIDWDLNWTRIHLCRTAKADELQVDLETLTPNLERLEMVEGTGSEWKRTAAAFTWKLQAGKNSLRARGVNAWGRIGKPAEVVVDWQPAQ